jgi:hypothetical protein
MATLTISNYPPDVFYNDGKARKFEVDLILQGSSHAQLTVTLLYERGDRVEDQSILEAVPGNALYLRGGRQCTLSFRFNQVSSKHLNRKFRVQFSCDGAVIETNAIEVKAKPPRKMKSDSNTEKETEPTKRRKLNDTPHAPNSAVVNAITANAPMLNVLRQIETNQLHILQRVSTLEQFILQLLPQAVQSHSTGGAAVPTSQPLANNATASGHPNPSMADNCQDSMGLDSLCAKILEQQQQQRQTQPQQLCGNIVGGVPSGIGIGSNGLGLGNGLGEGSIGGWIQDSLSALTMLR